MAEAAQFKDYFSGHAGDYAKYRPQYPPELFAYLASVSPGLERAWDVGTGNGQAALGLTPYFDEVVATDPSEEQLRNAFPHPKVTYKLARAEESGLEARSVDLVTVAQALHWFDVTMFFEEARQVLKPGGVIAVWCYMLCRITPEVDTIVDDFYWNRVGPYWPKERRLVDDGYRSLAFPFDELEPPELIIELCWDLGDLLNYLRTWSPVRRFIEQHGRDPVDEVEGELAEVWGDPDEEIPVTWPIAMRVGRA
jgi:SAM-dependent methyltransferase